SSAAKCARYASFEEGLAINGKLYNVKPVSKTANKTVAQKTNAARLLDGMGIRYELRDYEVDPNDLAAETVAAKIGLPPEQVFKTLVARGDRSGISMAVVPGDEELNLKALAAKRDYPVFIDETIELFDVVSISAGIRGLQILIAPADYLLATKGHLAP